MAKVITQAAATNTWLCQCKQCRKVITPDETIAYHLIDNVLYGWCQSCFDQRANERAMAARSQDARSAMNYIDTAQAKYTRGDLAGAINDYNKALKIDPSLAAAYHGRGNALKARGEIEEAIADYDKAIELNPRYSDAYSSRGNVRLTRQDIKGAIADYNQALAINPYSAMAYANRGLALLLEGKSDEAERDFDQFLRLSNNLNPTVEGRIKEIKRRLASKRISKESAHCRV
ncbi:MAG TPA: tetratricopeptide repeat protein [Blastocatellia bacterium]|nr:tetratricopeptide repeat protein [Blastocatellia bacterium]